MALTQWQLKPVATDTIASGDFVAFTDENETGDPINKLTVDNLMETGIPLVTEDAIAVASDYILFLDGGSTGNTNKEQFADVMTAIAGTGLSASSGVLNVDAAQTQITSVGTIGTGVWQGTAVAAAYMAQGTTSAKGALEIATSAEINTSTDADRAMTPDLFAASNYGIRYVQIMAVAKATDLTVTDGLAYFHVPAGLNGMDLVEVHAEVFTAPAGSTATFELSKNGASTQMLSTNITIDASETGSDSAATAAVIDTSNDNIATNDLIQINCTQIGSSTAGAGLLVTMGFRIP